MSLGYICLNISCRKLEYEKTHAKKAKNASAFGGGDDDEEENEVRSIVYERSHARNEMCPRETWLCLTYYT